MLQINPLISLDVWRLKDLFGGLIISILEPRRPLIGILEHIHDNSLLRDGEELHETDVDQIRTQLIHP